MKFAKMCATCIYRTSDKEFLSLPRQHHHCHEDDIGGDNEKPAACAGSVGSKGTVIRAPKFAAYWQTTPHKEIMDIARRKQVMDCKSSNF